MDHLKAMNLPYQLSNRQVEVEGKVKFHIVDEVPYNVKDGWRTKVLVL